MARFRYRAIDGQGAPLSGELDAADQGAAVAALRARGCMPVALHPAQGFDIWALLSLEITPRAALSTDDRIAFTRGLATLVGAGLPLDRALQLQAELGERRAPRRASSTLLAAVRDGAALSGAMAAQGSAFPPLYRGVVAAGEAAAALGPALTRLADAEEAAARRGAVLRSAMIYPAFLMAAAVGAIVLMLTVVVPAFEPLLADAGAAPPPLTRAVLGAARLLTEGWPLLLGAALTATLAMRVTLALPGVRARWARLWLRAPMAGPLLQRIGTAQACRLLAELTEGGVALPAALRLSADAAPNAAFAAEIARVGPLVEAGRGLSRPLDEGGVFAPLAVQLIRVGEESGRLSAMLAQSSDILQAQATAGLDRLTALLTPVLTLVMGGIIAAIVSSILFALLQINELTL